MNSFRSERSEKMKQGLLSWKEPNCPVILKKNRSSRQNKKKESKKEDPDEKLSTDSQGCRGRKERESRQHINVL